MSDWFNDNPSKEENSSAVPEAPEQPVTESIGDAPVSAADVPENTAADSAADAPGAVEPPKAPTWGSWQSGQQTTSWGTQQNGYTPYGQSYGQQPAYTTPQQPQNNTYGWQTTPTPSGDGKPPKKKKNAAAVVIAVLGVVCAATIVTLSVLLATAVQDNGPQTSGSGTTTSQGSSKTPSGTHTDLNLDIKPEAEEGLSTAAIIQKNLDNTVQLTMYDGSTSASGAASGIVLSEDGYIITNRHCVINEDVSPERHFSRIDVTMYDGTVYENAEIVGTDSYTDLAVIKVDAAGLQPAEFGDSTALNLGDRVVALGNPGGLGWTPTQGIISGLTRDVYEDTGYAIKCLQTDAAINPGNSGGPLLNTSGQVIAINSAKIVAEGYEGLGFAIPISEAKPLLEDLIQYGYVKGRVMLGITGRTTSYGFQILSFNEESVFNGTRAQRGDVITHIDGVEVKDHAAIGTELAKHSVGDQISITLLRFDSRTGLQTEIVVDVTLQEARGS